MESRHEGAMANGVLLVLAAGAGRRFGGDKQLAAVGPGGEAIMDYTVDRARHVGFDRVVVVTRPDLDQAMREHFDRLGWSFVELVHQLSGTAGTAPALLAARPVLADDSPFAVVNADDLYPLEALQALAGWTAPNCPDSGHVVLGFHLAATLLPGSGPVNRALCRCHEDGRLRELAEAAITIRPHDGGFVARERGAASDVVVPADQMVSMNAWAFSPSIWVDLEAAVASALLRASVARSPVARSPVARSPVRNEVQKEGAPADGEQRARTRAGETSAPARDRSATEVLLPVVIAELIARGAATVTVVPVAGSCLGITWPGELATLRELVDRMVAAGELPARLASRRPRQ